MKANGNVGRPIQGIQGYSRLFREKYFQGNEWKRLNTNQNPMLGRFCLVFEHGNDPVGARTSCLISRPAGINNGGVGAVQPGTMNK
jgi:hypothetical protein